MAHVAVGYFAKPDAVLPNKLLSKCTRIDGLPLHISNTIVRAQMRRRVAMAIEAELHCERLGLIGQRHAIDAAVAGNAADALGDVNVMPEVNVFRQARDTMPGQRSVLSQTLASRREPGRAGPDLRVAAHAGVCRRQTCARADLDGAVAITAIKPQPGHVVAMTEWNGLRRGVQASAGITVRARIADHADEGGP